MNRWRKAVWGTAACLLALPLVAMQFTTEVNWTLSDFTFMGALLTIACASYELGTRLSGSTAYRAAFGIAVVTGFLIIWINLAVGIIGSEHDSANLMFAGVLMVGAIAAAIVRFKPRGMAGALVATAVTQTVVGVVALTLGSMEGTLLSGFFAVAWLISAALFRKAADEQAPARNAAG